jgi:hypothetical protein
MRLELLAEIIAPGWDGGQLAELEIVWPAPGDGPPDRLLPPKKKARRRSESFRPFASFAETELTVRQLQSISSAAPSQRSD